MKKLKEIGPDCTGDFKYILPVEVYGLIDYTFVSRDYFRVEFYTDNPRHNRIMNYLKDDDYVYVYEFKKLF